MPTVGVTVLPKRVLAKHRTNQTTNSPAKKGKSGSRDHQQHKQKMKETERKQKHPSWVVRFGRRRRNATATKQTSPKKIQKTPKREKLTKTAKIRKRRQAHIYIYIDEHTTSRRPHALHTQHIPKMYIQLICIPDSLTLFLPAKAGEATQGKRHSERRQRKKKPRKERS